MRAMKKDPNFRKLMETQEELKDSEELAIDKRKSYSIDCTKSGPFHEMKPKPTMNVIYIFSGSFVLLRFNKNCKQPNFKCV